jgi:hypothetical protein
MTPEERQAELLARWLAGPAGDPPPDDLDPDVVDAVLATRPDRLPPPRVTAEEILASVTTGPLAAPVAGPPAEGPAPLDEPANRPLTRRAPPWARLVFGGGAVAALAAAVALLTLLPTFVADQAPTGAAARLEDAEPAPDAPVAAAPSTATVRQDAAPPPPPAADPAPAGGLIDSRAGGGAVGRRGGDVAAVGGDTSGVLGGVAGSSASTTGRGYGAPSAAEVEEDVVADLDDALFEDVDESSAAPRLAEGEPPPAPADRVPSEAKAEPRARAETTADAMELAAPSADSGMASTESRKATRREAARDAPTAAATAEPATAPPASSTRALPASEGSARPTGALSSVAIAPKRLVDEGRPTEALAACDAALARAPASGPERADLLWVRGLALWALGRTAEAERSFVDAAKAR